MISLVALTLAGFMSPIWHEAERPLPHCECLPAGEYWWYLPGGVDTLPVSAPDLWLSEGNRLLWKWQPGLGDASTARWVIGESAQAIQMAEATAPPRRLMLRGARWLAPVEHTESSPARFRVRRDDGSRADFLDLSTAQEVVFDVSGGGQLVVESLRAGADQRSQMLQLGWDDQPLATQSLVWPPANPQRIQQFPVQRLVLAIPPEANRLRLLAPEAVRLRVLQQDWRSADSAPGQSFLPPLTDERTDAARDNALHPDLRGQTAAESRAARMQFFRSLLPTHASAATVLSWQSPTRTLQAAPATVRPFASLGTGELRYELPQRRADTRLRIWLRGTTASLQLQLDQAAPLSLQLRERGPDDAPIGEAADGRMTLDLPQSTRVLILRSQGPGIVQVAVAYRTGRSFRLSDVAYRSFLKQVDAAALFRSTLVAWPAALQQPHQGTPAAELRNHWIPMLRTLVDRAGSPALERCADAMPDASQAAVSNTDCFIARIDPERVPDAALRQRLWAWQAVHQADPKQRQRARRQLQSSVASELQLQAAIAAVRLRADRDDLGWLAAALDDAGRPQDARDVAAIAGFELTPAKRQVQSDLAWSGSGAVPLRTRRETGLLWALRASREQPLSLPLPGGRLRLHFRPDAAAASTWLPLQLDGQPFAEVAVPAAADSSDLLDARSVQAAPRAALVEFDVPAEGRVLSLQPQAGEVLASVSVLAMRADGSPARGPIVLHDRRVAGGPWHWQQRLQMDRADTSDAAAAQLWQAAAQRVPGAQTALSWADRGRWQALSSLGGGAGYRMLERSARPAAAQWLEHNRLLPPVQPGERLLRSGRRLRLHGPGGDYRLQIRVHELFAAEPVRVWRHHDDQISVFAAGTHRFALAAGEPLELSIDPAQRKRQLAIRVQHLGPDGQWTDLPSRARSRWWVARADQPLRLHWPEPTLARIDSLRDGAIVSEWRALQPDQVVELAPPTGSAEMLYRVALRVADTDVQQPIQRSPVMAASDSVELPAGSMPDPLSDSLPDPWRVASALPAPAPARPDYQPDAWTDAVRVQFNRRPGAVEDNVVISADVLEVGWQRYRHLPARHSYLGSLLAVRRTDASEALGGEWLWDWQPPQSVWSASVDAHAWLTGSSPVLGLRLSGRGDWQYGNRWEHLAEASLQLRRGPDQALPDRGLWNDYRIDHPAQLRLEDQWNWWLSPAAHWLLRLDWRSNENLHSTDQYALWLGGRAALRGWSFLAELGHRRLLADGDRGRSISGNLLRIGADLWQRSSDNHAFHLGLSGQYDLRLRESSLELRFGWYDHAGRGLDDISPRRMRMLELRQPYLLEEWQ